MATLIKVKVLNKVKSQFGQQINQKLPKWITKQSGLCNIRHVSKLFFTVALLKGQSANGQGHIAVSCAITKFN